MIKKITKITNIGKFENYQNSEISFGKYVGIYGGNGQGKTTITQVIRSFSENNPKILIGRKTVGVAGEIVCKIETTHGFAKFKGTSWDRSEQSFLIFDSNFVNQNIYSGMYVGIDHRRRLYQFIIGDSAIHLNEKVNALTGDISEVTSEISKITAELNKTTGKSISIEDFIKLDPIENIDDVIDAKRRIVQSITEKDKILKRRLLESLPLPNLDQAHTESLLAKTIEDLSKESERKVRTHLETHLDNKGENWIKTGLSYLESSESKCPFCGLQLGVNELISSYKDFFNQEYAQLKEDIERLLLTTRTVFDEASQIKARQVVDGNKESLEFWKEYVVQDSQTSGNELQAPDVAAFFSSFPQTVLSALERKLLSPLEKFELSEIGIEWNNFQEHLEKIRRYNVFVETWNSRIRQHKEGLETSNLQTEQASFKRLELTKLRHQTEVNQLCVDYLTLGKKKEGLVEEKEKTRKELDEETQKVPAEYQGKINYYLERFGADFQIVDHRKVNPSGQAATEYRLMLKGVEISLGDNKTPEDVVSFQNTLSEGDKSTLAFAYFLAKLDSENDLQNKTLVFDDPISSLDVFRRTWTRNILRLFGQKADQLIVLSHDPSFIEEMSDSIKHLGAMTCLEISWDPEAQTSVIKRTTSDELNKNDHMRNLEKLKNYIKSKSGSPEDVKARIRHVCEHYLRRKYPRDFLRKDNLGSMVKKIREADQDDSVFEERQNLTDLEVLNDYSIQENHAQDGTNGRIDETELSTNCRLTFKLIGEPSPDDAGN